MDIEKDAKELLENVKKQRAESKGAAPAPQAKIKTKEELEKEAADKVKADAEAKEKATKDAEAKAKADLEATEKKEKELLSKKDEELDDAGKKNKSDIVKRNKVQERFNELTGQVKDLKRVVEDKGKETRAELAKREDLEKELTDLKKQLNMTPEDLFKQKAKQELSSSRSKYIEEDKTLPREDKREMTKEELNDWREEDPDAVTDWIARRGVRRMQEERDYVDNARLDNIAATTLKKQKESEKRTFEKHPELDFHEKFLAFEKEGKKPDEINEILRKENPKYKLCQEILLENPEKYMTSPNGPELITAEMEKRMKGNADISDFEALKKKVTEQEEEIERLKSLDTGLSSTIHSSQRTEEPEMTKKTKSLAAELGLDPERVASRAKKRTDTGGR